MYKKLLAFVLALSFTVLLFGCVKDETAVNDGEEVTENKETVFPEDMPETFYFFSGAGGWSTELYLNKDGSFRGYFHDSEMGSTGEGYPGGTYYECDFWGKFTNIEKVDDYTYSMTLSEIETKEPEGKEWIENEVLYIASYPYGLDGGTEFFLYTPDKPTEGLSWEFLTWWPGRYETENPSPTINSYAIHNVMPGYGFFSE